MEIDKDLRVKIIETARDVQHICNQLKEGKETFKAHAKRIRKIEDNQQFLAGKITILIMGIGALILFLSGIITKFMKG